MRAKSEARKSHFIGDVGECDGMNLHVPKVSSHFKSWSLDGLPNFQSVIAGVKTH